MVRESEEWFQHEIKEISFYVIFGLIMTVLLPIFLGFVLEAFKGSFVAGRPLQFGDIIVTYMIYYIMIIAGLIGLPILKLREMFVTKRGEDVAEQSKPSALAVAYLHDPEVDGALWNFFRFMGYKGKKNPMRFTLSMFRMFIIGTLIFATLGMLQTMNPKAQFVGIPQLPFQFTETAEVLFTAEPPAFAETTMMIFVLSLLMGLNAFVVSKFKMPKGVYWFIALVFVCPLVGLGWMGFHNIVYGNSETALFATFIFGWLGSTITVLFGTWILWYCWHFWNNIFAKVREVVPANEDIIFVSAVLIVLLLIFWIGTEILIRRMKKKDEFQGVVEPT